MPSTGGASLERCGQGGRGSWYPAEMAARLCGGPPRGRRASQAEATGAAPARTVTTGQPAASATSAVTLGSASRRRLRAL
jgi:hypothetical protein